MEKALAEALLNVALRETKDSYGNIVPSPLVQAMNVWVISKKEEFEKLVFNNLDETKLAEDLSKKITEKFKEGLVKSYWGGTDSENYVKKISTMVDKALVEILVMEKLKEMKPVNNSIPLNNTKDILN